MTSQPSKPSRASRMATLCANKNKTVFTNVIFTLWARQDLNLQSSAYEAAASTFKLRSR